MKRIFILLVSVFCLSINFTLIAAPGSLFKIASSGTAAAIDIVLCGNGKAPFSCQNYHVTGTKLSITATANHLYPAAGIKVSTPGFPPSGCTQSSNGYCLFTVSNTSPALITLSANTTPRVTVGYGQANNVQTPISYTSTDAGISWSNSVALTLPMNAISAYLGKVSCSQEGMHCVALGTSTNSTSTTLITYRTIDGGMHWDTAVQLSAPSGNSTFSRSGGLFCSESGLSCVVLATYQINGVFQPVSYSSSDGGLSWSSPNNFPPIGVTPNNPRTYAISCDSSAQRCIAIGRNTNRLLSYITTNGGTSWSSPVIKQMPSGITVPTLFGLSCSTNGLTCTTVASDSASGLAFSYFTTDGGLSWSDVTFLSLPGAGDYFQVGSVSCNISGNSCVVVGELSGRSASYTTTNNGINWSAPILPTVPTGSVDNSFNGLMCDKDAINCIAVGSGVIGGITYPYSYTSTDGGNSWNQMTLLSLYNGNSSNLSAVSGSQ